MEVGKEDLRAREEVVADPRGKVAELDGLGDQTSHTREVDREVRETRDCKRWRKGGWRWSRQGWR